MGWFYLKFLLTNILFSMAIGLWLIKWNNKKDFGPHPGTSKFPNRHLLLYSLGLGPVFTVLILYYSMLFIRGLPNLFYFSAVLSLHLFLTIYAGKTIKPLYLEIKTSLATNFTQFLKGTVSQKIEGVLYWFVIFALITGFAVLYLGNTLQIPMDGHDVMVYGNMGKIYYKEKAVKYDEYMQDQDSGFFFQGSPKPSFSLLLTWEMIVDGTFRKQTNEKKETVSPKIPETTKAKPVVTSQQTKIISDLYFKSISAYYGMLIVAVLFLWLYKANKYLALLGVFVLFSGLRFVMMAIHFHLDAYRLFFLLMSWIFLGYSIKQKDRFSLFLLGAFSGFTAFTHPIGVIVAAINGLTLLIFSDATLKEKLQHTISFALLVLAFGGIHYLLEPLFGAPWGIFTYFA